MRVVTLWDTLHPMKVMQTSIRLDQEHAALLEALCEHERLRRTDVIQRALRHYAGALGVGVKGGRRRAKGK